MQFGYFSMPSHPPERSLKDGHEWDLQVIRWLDERPEVQRLLDEYAQFIGARITEHRAAHRRYLTLGVGCTGGQHRSVYLVERLVQRLAPEVPGLSRRHHSLDLPGRT